MKKELNKLRLWVFVTLTLLATYVFLFTTPSYKIERVYVYRCEEESRRFIFSSPRVVILQYEPGPAEGQYWHYHRFSHIPNPETLEFEWIICDTHWFDYPVAYPMVSRRHERCEDPDCELPRFYQPCWRRRGN